MLICKHFTIIYSYFQAFNLIQFGLKNSSETLLGIRGTMSTYQSFEEKLQLIEIDIQKYNKNMNDSGIWLFLATLGCWGVTQEYLQVIAVIFTFIIFSHKLIKGFNEFKFFSTILKEQISKIENSELDEKSKKALNFDIVNFKKKNLCKSRVIMHVPAYYLSMVFLSASIFYWGWYN